MIIQIFNRKYKLNQIYANKARTLLNNILLKIMDESREKGIPEFYTTFVILMYTTSSILLQQIGSEDLRKVLEKDKDGNLKDYNEEEE